MDYEELLKKYMQHVLDCEGTDFVWQLNSGGPCDVEFTAEEVEILEKLSEDICE